MLIVTEFGEYSFSHLLFCTDTFLELLEPYILNDKLGSLPPEVYLIC